MERINVTKTFLPPIEEYEKYLKQIWDSVQLTNQGPLLQQFEQGMKTRLGVNDFQFVSNGTVALQLALKALDITEGEIITTPFSYVATTSAILWEHFTPIFVDIDPETYCMDPDKIEAAITPKTRAILPVHVFGIPCDVEKIQAIADKHNLKVVYDAAHAFGVTYKGKSLLNYGDIATCSFHATKLFHTIEGGCVVTNNELLAERIELTKHFGHVGDEHYALGINAKANEFQAAMGLCNLPYVDTIIAERKALSELYDELLDPHIRRIADLQDTERNYIYYPVVFETEAALLKTMANLNAEQIFPRRYFYPSLNTLPYVEGESCPVSEDISTRIACLPLYAGLSKDAVAKIAKIVNET